MMLITLPRQWTRWWRCCWWRGCDIQRQSLAGHDGGAPLAPKLRRRCRPDRKVIANTHSTRDQNMTYLTFGGNDHTNTRTRLTESMLVECNFSMTPLPSR